jgi:hypothetical protein
MISIEQSQQARTRRITAQVWDATRIFGGVLSAFEGALRTLGELRVSSLPAGQAGGELSELFARAVCENSSRARDWLAYAEQLDDPAERRYCIDRALLIDPAARELIGQLRRFR